MAFVRSRGVALLCVLMVSCAVIIAGAPTPAHADVIDDNDPTDQGRAGPVDDGGPAVAAAPVRGVQDAHRTGAWSAVADWPLSALHAILLPNGKVMTYGTDARGRQSYGFDYDIWDPRRGLGAGSHTTLPVRTRTNLFCSAQTVLAGSGQVLLTGGEENGLPGGGFNDAVNDVNLFNPAGNTMTRLADAMSYPRWYPTTTTLPNGEVLVHGGRDDKPDLDPALVPEVYSEVNGWRRLPGAASREVYGDGRWWYPRSWVAPDGKVFIVTKGNRGLWSLSPKGGGSMRRVGTYPGPTTDNTTPAAMFDVGRILLTRRGGKASVIDINGATPRVTETGSLRSYRSWSDATVLANGEVLVSGGSSRTQLVRYATNKVEIWNPATGRWRTGPGASKARLYHSTAMLLPDGTVLTAGGGPPGPVTNLNAEIYYPSYLFDRDGRLADRPRITGVDDLDYGGTFGVGVAGAESIARVALIRTGSVTHSFDMDQRFMELDFAQSGDALTVRAPRNANLAPPGRYLLFVFDEAGVPSVAEIVELDNTAQPVSADVQTGSVTLAQTASGSWVTMTFERPFERTPVVAVGAASSHGGEPAMPRIRNVTTRGFELKLDEWPYQDGRHTFETLSFVAAVPGRHQIGDVTLEAGAFTADGGWRQASFAGAFGTTPVVLPQVASNFDGRAATVRLRGVNARGFQVRVQGQEAHERRGRFHGEETVHYLALTPGRGTITGRPISVGVTKMAVTHRLKRLNFGRTLATPRLIAAGQTTTGGDPVTLRYGRLTATTATVRIQEEQSYDRELRHGRERVGWVAVGAR